MLSVPWIRLLKAVLPLKPEKVFPSTVMETKTALGAAPETWNETGSVTTLPPAVSTVMLMV